MEEIGRCRAGEQQFDDIILSGLLRRDNYQAALRLLLSEPVNEELICTVGINRKSKTYDKPYYRYLPGAGADRVSPGRGARRSVSRPPRQSSRTPRWGAPEKTALRPARRPRPEAGGWTC